MILQHLYKIEGGNDADDALCFGDDQAMNAMMTHSHGEHREAIFRCRGVDIGRHSFFNGSVLELLGQPAELAAEQSGGADEVCVLGEVVGIAGETDPRDVGKRDNADEITLFVDNGGTPDAVADEKIARLSEIHLRSDRNHVGLHDIFRLNLSAHRFRNLEKLPGGELSGISNFVNIFVENYRAPR